MKITKSYIKQVIREELKNNVVNEGAKEVVAAAVTSLAMAAGAQAKPVTITSETDGVKKTFVVDAPEDATPEEIQSYLQGKANAKEAAKPAVERGSPVQFLDVHDSTPEEVSKLPVFKKSQQAGKSSVKQADTKKTGPQIVEKNKDEFTVTGVADANSATQAVIEFLMNRDGKVNKRLVPQKIGNNTYVVKSSQPVRENKLTKSFLKKIILEEIQEIYRSAREFLITDVEIDGRKYEVRYGGEEAMAGEVYIQSINGKPTKNMKPEFMDKVEQALIDKLSRTEYH